MLQNLQSRWKNSFKVARTTVYLLTDYISQMQVT